MPKFDLMEYLYGYLTRAGQRQLLRGVQIFMLTWIGMAIAYRFGEGQLSESAFQGLYWLALLISLYAFFLVVTALNMRQTDDTTQR